MKDGLQWNLVYEGVITSLLDQQASVQPIELPGFPLSCRKNQSLSEQILPFKSALSIGRILSSGKAIRKS